ncbi:MAG: polymer-forming cytoskeletal protein [Pseudomonadota bacterium]|nr:polymer-forming cytoskeletal protein [Pseudomonadota bacterium]
MFKQPARDVPPQPRPEPAPEPAAAPLAPTAPFAGPERRRIEQPAASVIASDLLIKGGIEGRGEIQLQGKAWGDVKVERLMVGEAAMLEGSVDAVVVEVRGKVTGSITARQVRLLASAKVEGDITYEQLSIDNGAHFEGRCIKSTTKSEGPLPLAAPSPPAAAATTPEATPATETEPVPA